MLKKNIKQFVCVILLLNIIGIFTPKYVHAIDGITVYLDQQKISVQTSPILSKGIEFISVNKLLKALGYEVYYDQVANLLSISKDQYKESFPLLEV